MTTRYRVECKSAQHQLAKAANVAEQMLSKSACLLITSLSMLIWSSSRRLIDAISWYVMI
jgi:low affinity Fe/Cu permease